MSYQISELDGTFDGQGSLTVSELQPDQARVGFNGTAGPSFGFRTLPTAEETRQLIDGGEVVLPTDVLWSYSLPNGSTRVRPGESLRMSLRPESRTVHMQVILGPASSVVDGSVEGDAASSSVTVDIAGELSVGCGVIDPENPNLDIGDPRWESPFCQEAVDDRFGLQPLLDLLQE